MTNVIRNLEVRGRHFTIAKNDEGFYMAIEDKYITDGKMNTTLNGLQMHASKDLNDCLKGVNDEVEVEYLISTGKTKAQAMAIHFNIPYTEQLEALFA